MGRREDLLAELAELEEAAATEAAGAVDDAVDAVGGTADEAVETAQEAADSVVEAVEEAAEVVAEETGQPVDEIVREVIARLESEGRLVANVAEDAVDEAAAAPDVIVGEVTDAIPDTIHPRSEHPYYRRRRIFGREI